MIVDAYPRTEPPAAHGARGPQKLACRGVGFASVTQAPSGVGALVKRAVDIVGAGVLLIGLAPILVLTGLAVRIESAGPVLIRQTRVGHGLRPFRMFKFRSMVADAEQRRESLQHLNEAAPLFKIRNDPRLTRIGSLLRRSSLDELPQLWNVVRGEMSLVGPRPPFAHEVEHDPIRQLARLRFPPGMTGLWQVRGRSDLDYESMVTLDLEYARNWSLLADASILLQTIPIVFTGKGAR